jgi:hypothetical protein
VPLKNFNADEYHAGGDIVVNFIRIWLEASKTVDVVADCNIILLQGKLIIGMSGVPGLLEAFMQASKCYYGAANSGFCKDGLKDCSVPEVEFGQAGYLLTRPLLEELKCAPLLRGLEDTRYRVNALGELVAAGCVDLVAVAFSSSRCTSAALWLGLVTFHSTYLDDR